MSEQPPWQPLPAPPANPYGYPPPPNPYAAPTYGYPPPQNRYAAPPQNPYGPPPPHYLYPSPSPYSAAPPPAHHARNLVIAGIVLALVVAAVVVEAAYPRSSTASSPGRVPAFTQAHSSPTAPAPSNQANQPSPTTQPTPAPTSDGVTASSALSPTSGVELFSDDFTDPTSGWTTGADPKGATFAYGPDGYTITSTVAAHWLAHAPYSDPAQQLNLNMTAHESAGARSTAGFGLVCRRGPDSTTDVRYEFIVNESNRWFIERNQGAASMSSTSSLPTILDEGALPTKLGTQSLEISGICATLADGQTTRLALFIGAQKVADITDVSSLDSDGWLGGLLSSGSDVPSTTTVVGYAASDLGHDGILAANT